MLNRVFEQGRLGGDPEMRVTTSGTEVVNFSLAVYQSKEVTNWFRCVAFGEQAKRINASARKGSKVIVEGHLNSRTWEQDGKRRESVEIIVDNCTYLDPPPTIRPVEDAGELPF